MQYKNHRLMKLLRDGHPILEVEPDNEYLHSPRTRKALDNAAQDPGLDETDSDLTLRALGLYDTGDKRCCVNKKRT